MRFRAIVLLGLAVFFGGAAVFVARAWLEGQRGLILAQAREAPAQTIVVAARALRFGDPLKSSDLKQIGWGSRKLPEGTFATKAEILKDGSREVTSAIEAGEPIFKWKVSGSGQRATLSTVINGNMKAITIRVNDVLGVAGFVLPGGRVDVLLTREGGGRSYVDVLLQGVKVLAIDQTADERREKPTVVKAVTFEVSTEEAQKLTLAASIGQLSLALRNRSSAAAETTKRVTMRDLDSSIASALNKQAASPPAANEQEAAPPAKPEPTNMVVGVWRGLKRAEYRVSPTGWSVTEAPDMEGQ